MNREVSVSSENFGNEINPNRTVAGKWKWVSRGLTLKLGAITLSSLALLAVSALAVVNAQTLWRSNIGYWIGAGFFAALVIDFMGRSMCIAAPVAQSTRASIAASIGCQFAAIIAFVAAVLMIQELDLPARLLIGALLAGFAHTLAALFFVVFARNIAVSLDRVDLASTPLAVLFLFGGSLSTSMVVVLSLGVLLMCPCMWWFVYVPIAVMQQTWQANGLPEHWLWPFVRLVPALLVGLLYWVPVYRYARLLRQLRSAVDQRASQFE